MDLRIDIFFYEIYFGKTYDLSNDKGKYST